MELPRGVQISPPLLLSWPHPLAWRPTFRLGLGELWLRGGALRLIGRSSDQVVEGLYLVRDGIGKAEGCGHSSDGHLLPSDLRPTGTDCRSHFEFFSAIRRLSDLWIFLVRVLSLAWSGFWVLFCFSF